MAVAAPVPMTTPRARPAVTTVPLNSVLVLSCAKGKLIYLSENRGKRQQSRL